jgi:hypothetical protein
MIFLDLFGKLRLRSIFDARMLFRAAAAPSARDDALAAAAAQLSWALAAEGLLYVPRSGAVTISDLIASSP